MLTFFRNFFKTKIGLALVLAFLGVIGFAFASMDVSSTGAFGGVAGGDSVAVVGDRKIGTAELNQAANDALRSARQENPEITLQSLLADDGLDNILGGLIDRYTITAWAEANGFRAGTNLVNSEIRQIPAARGASGEFDQAAYEMFLRSNSLTDAQVRQQVKTSMLFQQSILSSVYGPKLPESITRTYARAFKERRTGAIATISASLFAPQGDPSADELTKFYNENRNRFIRPERRTIRYATFDSSALGDTINPTSEEIAAYYEANAAQYAASESRSFTQLIVPTREGAAAIAQRVRAGESFAQAASSAGLRPTQLESQSRSDIAGAASSAVAEAYFAASEGAVTAPAQGPLGWHIARVSDVQGRAARSLESVRGEITEVLREQKRQRGLAELAVGIEDRLGDGASLTSVAEELGLELKTTQPVTANGQVYGTTQAAPRELASVLGFAFQVEENEAEIGALGDQQNFVIYEVADITPSAAAPLAEIRSDVIAQWRLAKGNEGARAAADRILKRVEKGASLANAVAAEKVAIGAPEPVNVTRSELARLGGRVPTPLALMFAMAEGSVKKLQGAQNQGWTVVELEDITLDELEENDPLIAQARAQVAQAWSSEYAEQMIAAMRAELGVERNPDAIAAVRRQLIGETN